METFIVTGFTSKRRIALDRLDDDDIQIYAQPTQEPVAWAIYDKRGGSKSLHWPENHSPNGDATKFDAVPLVPQRPWVGLAAEDRLCAKYMQDAPDGIEAVIDYIEAKLKEINT